MKVTQNKKIIAIMLTAVLAPANLFASMPSDFESTYSEYQPSKAYSISIPVVTVVNFKAASQQLQVLRGASENLISGCSASNSEDLLQTAATAELLTKPADCFNLNLSKAPMVQANLAVSAEPLFIPKITVFNFQDKISNEFSFPGLPAQSQGPTLPTTVNLAIIFSGVLIGLKYLAEKFKLNQRNFNNLAFPKLTVLRC